MTGDPRPRLPAGGARGRDRRLLFPGLALVLAAVVPACRGAEPPARRTVVTIHHSMFQPAHLDVRLGEKLEIVVRNTDPIDHELILGNEAVQARHESGTEPHHGVVPGEVSVPAAAERTTTYVFKVPGTLEFACHLPGHYAYGMRGTVTVHR